MNDLAVFPLSRGGFAVIDADLQAELSKFKWCRGIKGYAVTTILIPEASIEVCGTRLKGARIRAYLHKIVNNTPSGFDTDHINGCVTDCTRRNLRSTTRSQNAANRGKNKGKYTSRFKGVSWHVKDKKWQAVAAFKKKVIHVGRFDSEIDAARAYDGEIKRLRGPTAWLNFQ